MKKAASFQREMYHCAEYPANRDGAVDSGGTAIWTGVWNRMDCICPADCMDDCLHEHKETLSEKIMEEQYVNSFCINRYRMDCR